MTGTAAASDNASDAARPVAPRGGVRVHERALHKVIREAAADTIGVTRDDVTVEVRDAGGSLTVRVSTRVSVPDLADADAVRAHTPVMEFVHESQPVLAHRFAHVTGRQIRRVSVTVTGAITRQRRKVH